jgi:hypothetical protein
MNAEPGGMVRPSGASRVMAAMDVLGYTSESNEENNRNFQHLMVLLEVFELYLERNGRYNDEWRVTGWRGALFELRKKVSRVWRVFWKGTGSKPEHILYDDALDAINFIVFFIRLHREAGPEWGEWT